MQRVTNSFLAKRSAQLGMQLTMKVSQILIAVLICFENQSFTFCNENLSENLDIIALDAALQFDDKWLASNKLYITYILPQQGYFKLGEVYKMIKKSSTDFAKNRFVMATLNSSKVDKELLTQNELIWLPFKMAKYDVKQTCRTFFHPNTTRQQHFLLNTDTKHEANIVLRKCRFRFDSNVVIYYRQIDKNTSSFTYFEEIYKMQEDSENLESNVLARIDTFGNESDLSGLNEFIWKRRSNLQGTSFKAITEFMPPYVINVTKYNASDNKSVIVEPHGYYPDIVNRLQGVLNFTISSQLSKYHLNFTYLTNTIAEGQYDIGYTFFAFDRKRKDGVDFSFGITPISFSLFYFKGFTSRYDLGAFVKPFKFEVWYTLAIYSSSTFLTIISIGFILKRKEKNLMKKNMLPTMIRAINFLLRSIVGKSIPSEPKSSSVRVAFLSLVLAGFFFITVYRVILVAFATVEIQNPPIRSFNELRTSNYLLAVHKDTAMESIFVHASETSEEYKLEKEKKIVRFTEGVEDYVDKMIHEETESKNIILLYIDQVVKYLEYYPCIIEVVKEKEHHVDYNAGMIFKKNWEFTGLINYHLLRMKEDGSLKRYLNTYEKSIRKLCPDDQIIRPVLKIPKPASLESTFLLYIIMALGIGGAFILLSCEMSFKRY